MRDAYSFADDVQSLPERIPAIEETIRKLPTQTVECTMFIRECNGSGFAGKVLSQILVMLLIVACNRKGDVHGIDDSSNR